MLRTMNQIKSSVADIAALKFYPIPTRPMKNIVAVVRSAHVTVAVSDKRRVYSSQVQAGGVYWQPLNRMADTVDCLIKLGMLTPEAVCRHREAESEERFARTQWEAARNLRDDALTLGLELTGEQKRAIDDAIAAYKE